LRPKIGNHEIEEVKKQPIPMELEVVELKDHLEEKVHKLEIVKDNGMIITERTGEEIM
jgi:hypothetical protein